MADNIFSVHQMLAREGAEILKEEASFLGQINRGRDSDFGKPVEGYAKGDFVDISVPFVPVVFDGPVFAGGNAAPAVKETKVRLQLNTQKHTAVTITSVEKALKLESERERILRPAMQSLASIVQADLLMRAVLATSNSVGTPGTIPNTMRTYAQARAKLQKFLAPPADRSCMFSSDANTEMVDTSKVLFNPNKAIAEQYKTGVLGDAQGMSFFENQSLPSLTNGTQANTFTLNGVPAAGATSLTVTALTGTLTAGQVFTVATVNAVHPITGQTLGASEPRQFVVTADCAAGASTVPFSPAMVPTTATEIGNVSKLPAAAGVATLVGGAGVILRKNLVFQKNAFAAAFANLGLIPGTVGYSAMVDGFGVRVMSGGSFTADTSSTRIDVLYGFAGVRPDHASRVTE